MAIHLVERTKHVKDDSTVLLHTSDDDRFIRIIKHTQTDVRCLQPYSGFDELFEFAEKHRLRNITRSPPFQGTENVAIPTNADKPSLRTEISSDRFLF